MFKEKENHIEYNIGLDFFDKLFSNDDKFILVVLRLPPAEEFDRWIDIKEDYTKLQKCAYFREVSYSDKKSWIEIPKTNILNSENLNNLFQKPKSAQL
jgi:hypothetical protein